MLGRKLRRLESRDADKRRQAAEELGRSKDIRAIQPLVEAMKDEDRDVRRAAVEALGWLAIDRDLSIAIGKEEGLEQRRAALRAQAVQPLTTVLRDADREVRKAGAEALAYIGEERIGS